MQIEKIYLDMDGVLADFDRGMMELCGMDMSKQDTTDPDERTWMWELVRRTDHFYARLPLMPHAQELFARTYGRYGDRCEILTALPKPERQVLTAHDDKIAWVRQYLSSQIVVHTVQRESKKDFARGPGYILIDDFSKNITAWQEAGGTGIHYTDYQKAVNELAAIEQSR